MADPAASPEERVRQMFGLVDGMETAAMAAMLTDDVQGIDEISRGWMRGRPALETYLDRLAQSVGDLRSEVRELEASEWDDTAVVTCVVDQTYREDGEQRRITAPTSMTLRREGGEWKIALFHLAPLPDQR